MTTFGQVVALEGRCVRLHGVPGWLAAQDLRPCPCGERRFLVLQRGNRTRVICRHCPIKQWPDEQELGEVTMPAGGRQP